MKADPSDRIDPRAMVKGTMLRAHLSWATSRFGAGYEPVRQRLSEPVLALLSRPVLPTDWIPVSSLIELDRAIADAAGEPHHAVHRCVDLHEQPGVDPPGIEPRRSTLTMRPA